MENLITEIPACPDSITTGEARELFMDLCDAAIRQQRLTKVLVESISGYCFLNQLTRMAEQALLESPCDLTWNELWSKCLARELEYSEIIGLTPLDAKNLGLI